MLPFFLYVDDMLIFGTSLQVVCETKKFLGSKFDMKDIGNTKVILGISDYYSKSVI